MGNSPSTQNVFNLYVYCPACKVASQNGPSYWRHESCGQTSTINKDAYIGCKGNTEHCNQTKPFIHCYWKCNNHRNEAKPASAMYAAAGLITATKAIANASSGYPPNAWREISSALVLQCMLFIHLILIYMYIYISLVEDMYNNLESNVNDPTMVVCAINYNN